MIENEWNEQVEYSEFYFKITMACRYYQSQNSLSKWYWCLEAKTSYIIGVIDKKSVEELKKARLAVQTLFGDYLEARDKSRVSGRMTSKYKQTTYILKEALFEFEAGIDREINKVMPFLNLKKKVDIQGL